MLEPFSAHFGDGFELGPKDHPRQGHVLYRRTGGRLIKEFTLESSGWAVDQKGQRAFRLGDGAKVYLPSGKQIAQPKLAPPTKPKGHQGNIADRLFKARGK